MERQFVRWLLFSLCGFAQAVRAQDGMPVPSPMPNDPYLLQVGAVAVGIILLIYLILWVWVGRDPAKGVIRPLAAPPAGLSPAAVRFLQREGHDSETLIAALAGLAVKGMLYFRENGAQFAVVRQAGPYPGEAVHEQLRRMAQDGTPLSADERFLAERLFHNRATFPFNAETGRALAQIMRLHAGQLRAKLHGRYLHNNAAYQAVGIGASVLALLVVSAAFQARHPWWQALMLVAGLLVMTSVPYLLMPLWMQWRTPAASAEERVSRIGFSLLRLATVVVILGICRWLLAPVPWPLLATLIAMAALNLLFSHLLRAPTPYGRRVLDQVEGYRQYLTGEGDPADASARTVQAFEAHLPYALALDAADAWTARCRDALNHPGTAGPWYIPAWYAGAALCRGGMRDLVQRLQHRWPNAITTARLPDPATEERPAEPAAAFYRDLNMGRESRED